MPTDIEIRDLVVRFRYQRAVDLLSLNFDTGVNGLLGPNGAGKTSLIRVLATAQVSTSGDVQLLGERLTGQEAELRALRRRIGYLPQHFGYYPRFTAREFVEYFAWLKEVPADKLPLAVDRALERVNLIERADSKMRTLSGGMLRRVGIAQAIVNDPAILLLDEPTTGLDPEQRVSFRAMLRQFGEESCVVVSTHLIEDVASVCHSVSIMDYGRPVFTGTPEQLAAAGRNEDTGDTELERGYTSKLNANRSKAA